MPFSYQALSSLQYGSCTFLAPWKLEISFCYRHINQDSKVATLALGCGMLSQACSFLSLSPQKLALPPPHFLLASWSSPNTASVVYHRVGQKLSHSFWVHISMPSSGARLHRKQGYSLSTNCSGTPLPTATLAGLISPLQRQGTSCLASLSVTELGRHKPTATTPTFLQSGILSTHLRVTPRICAFPTSLEVSRLTWV